MKDREKIREPLSPTQIEFSSKILFSASMSLTVKAMESRHLVTLRPELCATFFPEPPDELDLG